MDAEDSLDGQCKTAAYLIVRVLINMTLIFISFAMQALLQCLRGASANG